MTSFRSPRRHPPKEAESPGNISRHLDLLLARRARQIPGWPPIARLAEPSMLPRWASEDRPHFCRALWLPGPIQPTAFAAACGGTYRTRQAVAAEDCRALLQFTV